MTTTDDPTTRMTGGGRAAVAQHAPASAVVLDRLERTTWEALDTDLLELTAGVVASVHGYPPLERPRDLGASVYADRDASRWSTFDDLDDTTRVALSFAEQFSTDVSMVSAEARADLLEALGDSAFPYAQAVYVLDVVPRARVVLDRLFGPSPVEAPTSVPEPYADVWTGIEAFIDVVPGLVNLDPITTELVRLRLARHHNCRICKSLRSYSALAAGADDDTFAAIDSYATSTLDDATKAALALVDTIAWTPARMTDDLVDDLHRHFTAPQLVEIVLDTARNSANKFAVAMAVDDPHITEGVEIYDVAPDGTMTYGMERPAARS